MKDRAYVLLFVFIIAVCNAKEKSPHIVFVVGDDLGWNDLGFHNPDILSPTLDKFAHDGVILNNSYMQPMCTPSRAAFLSGYYPFHTGIQHYVIDFWQPNYLTPNVSILPQYLKQQGYATHLVGKWHLGFCNWRYTPTFRGFDTFYGYYQGGEGYFNRTIENGYDFRDNTTIVYDRDTYSTNLFTARAVDIINNHDVSKPLFLYLPFQNVHYPVEVPKKYENMYSHIKDRDRRIYSGMVSAMDEAFKNITDALEAKGLTDNLILAFTADNGGALGFGANNLPLQGGKTTLWEGGTRAISFVHSKTLLKKRGYTHNGIMHAVDWFATFVDAAGLPRPSGIDGMSQWKMWTEGTPSTRQEMVYNIDDIYNNSAIRDSQYKLLIGDPGIGGWPVVPQSSHNDQQSDPHPPAAPGPVPDLQLYDLNADPGEHNNIADQHKDVVERLQKRLDFYKSSALPARFPANTPAGDPANFGGVWSPGWCD